MRLKQPTHGMNVRDAVQLARRLGASVTDKRATDDVVVGHPHLQRRVIQSLGRKDANRELTSLLRDLWNLVFGSSQRVVCV